MKNTFSKIIVLPISALLLLLNANPATARDRLDRLDLELNAGSRVDRFDWTISGNIHGTDPDILSELSWDDLEIVEVNTKGRVIMINNQAPFGGIAKIRAGYGEIRSGENQDSDYQYDNRTNEWSRSNNQADDGSVFDFTSGIGLVFQSRNGTVLFSPLVGYSYHTQDLTIHDGYQTISRDNPFSTDPAEDPPPVGPLEGLGSTYDSTWNSGWIGIDLEIRPTRGFLLHGFVELHGAEYRAEANWNLRSDLAHPVSFEHESNDAAGFVAGFGTKFGGDRLLVNLDMLYQKWRAEDGIDVIYFADGSIGATRLNEVNWESFGVTAGLTVSF
ncbi:MAG: hypothetical protein RQ753_01130 [Desulfurivibrionaceae bacterium]|nr:hypothetical protein [Desulfobulbales bacterium]MDT8334279.1 hypothetical protein [Desulfurivibrionaceae bacterium]